MCIIHGNFHLISHCTRIFASYAIIRFILSFFVFAGRNSCFRCSDIFMIWERCTKKQAKTNLPPHCQSITGQSCRWACGTAAPVVKAQVDAPPLITRPAHVHPPTISSPQSYHPERSEAEGSSALHSTQKSARIPPLRFAPVGMTERGDRSEWQGEGSSHFLPRHPIPHRVSPSQPCHPSPNHVSPFLTPSSPSCHPTPSPVIPSAAQRSRGIFRSPFNAEKCQDSSTPLTLRSE